MKEPYEGCEEDVDKMVEAGPPVLILPASEQRTEDVRHCVCSYPRTLLFIFLESELLTTIMMVHWYLYQLSCFSSSGSYSYSLFLFGQLNIPLPFMAVAVHGNSESLRSHLCHVHPAKPQTAAVCGTGIH